MYKRPKIFVSLLAVALFFSACSPKTNDLTIASSVPSLEYPFILHMAKELRKEVKNYQGVELLEYDGRNSASQQTADVEAAIIMGVDGLIIAPIDSVAMAPALKKAVQAGIPTLTLDRSIENVPGILGHVGADNVKGGEQQGNFIKQMFPEGATIVNLRGEPGSSPAIDRNKGLHNIIDGDDRYKFIAEQTANWRREKGASVTEALMAGLGSPPDVIVAANDDMALGALRAMTDMGHTKVKIIGFDALPEALGSVRDGGLAATIEQQPGVQSRAATKALLDYLQKGIKPEPLNLITPIVITKDNLESAERLGEL